MRILADENFPLPTIDALRQAGHDVIWARTYAPGAKDASLLDTAEREERILLTLDKDFWQIAVQRREPLGTGGVILFRVHPAIPEKITRSSSVPSELSQNGQVTLLWSPKNAC